ncbi:3-methyl-2-oxobutanoate hydroxymethyltransferase [Candidatus Nitromaritima sp. SCGC AAA799-C22]|nr:3-methyl-2-oxobutanoate hydroxymethyltransferase [Candidatus Nitromaritima sp. SCGC AAA799-C22]
MTVPGILERKNSAKKIVALTAYDYSFSRLLDATDLDVILVGDSLAMVSLGHETTLPVTMDEMILHTRAVNRGSHNALLVADMPFMSYQVSDEQAIANAGRFIQEAGAEAVKIEGGARMAGRIRAVTDTDIPVMGHIGLTPQSVNRFGGYRVQGKNFKDARQIKQDARKLQEAGVFSIVLEGIPHDLAAEITLDVKVPTIGIGAGPDCDGQILVLHDLLGLGSGFIPKFVKQYASLGEDTMEAVSTYIQEVREGAFPAEEHCYKTKSKKLKRLSDKDCG